MVIIKNFTKPATCWRCPFLTDDDWLCLAAKKHVYTDDNPRPKWCPLKEVEE